MNTDIIVAITLACALASLKWRAHAASFTSLRRQLAHLVLQVPEAVEPAESEAEWNPTLYLLVV